MFEGRTTPVWVLLVLGLAGAAAYAQQQEKPKPPPVQHELEGRGACLTCHTPGAIEKAPDAPDSHEGWTNEMCLMCHAPDAAIQTTQPPVIRHKLEGRGACVMCHRAGVMEKVPDMPADHEGRTNDYCTLCHEPAPQG